MELKALPGTFYRAGRLQPPELSAEARERLRWLQAWEALRDKGLTSVECSQVLQAPRATIYRWRGRWRQAGPSALEDGARGPQKPKEYAVNTPGHLVQLDTLDLRPLPGLVLKQFTARDVVSRWDVVEVYSVATARTASAFLGALKERSPFPIRAIQVDGGSEFMGEFETACQGSDLQLFVLPPRSPKLNGHVERAQRTHTEEFWERYDGDLELPAVRPALRHWEHLYNTFRPHQALAGRTPAEYLAKCHPEAAPAVALSHM